MTVTIDGMVTELTVGPAGFQHGWTGCSPLPGER
jgi:hypothetical protein